jgi:hypothetical protein
VSTEQEYDEQADMIDQEDPSEQSPAGNGHGPGPFPPTFPPPQSMQPPMPPAQNPNYTSSNVPPPNESGHVGAAFNGMNQLFDPYDPMLDADPFGLSASMHFPTLYDSR